MELPNAEERYRLQNEIAERGEVEPAEARERERGERRGCLEKD